MEFIIFLIVATLICVIQYVLGKHRKGILGSILPVFVIIFWFILLFTGNISFKSIQDVLMPMLLLLSLISVYYEGEKSAK
ncbi:glucan phosphoethanolaminetransferase (alkaline phosphatase superfamily) [Weissella uvarum]|uniref:hypothetical protein n=1 Tax=Weissella uvarum TaxID=1479233 RepID=UPI0019618B68|nr:hypothetical protein [Weissella uvarum]MBM7616934.1 glucan phosphoethanolaminetransferase (alkaline phosphatase superfamily) [Weissella uvarum]MCM0594615.1 hypothetical protein [Weissella uvarum]